MSLFWAILIIVAVAIVWLITMYNGLIKRRNRVSEGWSDIDVQLKRRYDLIPNLVETVKGYAAHEKGVLENVTAARTRALSAEASRDVKELAAAENMLAGALKTLFAVSENYPNLRASENFTHLQMDLTDTENKIQAARRFYNGTVMEYNTAIESFPNNMIANAFGFTKREFFELEQEAAKEPVKVSF